ncbi:MAG: zinc-dependent alcohol dehydrogenase family protein [Gammaproteobacteria bacterium]|nr:zinc-dependent alcohol dehydrogenase family protein [Gammaproteobacteria bacterium]MBU1732866.1 zinc-dependent alcohol dehydrogenase family protein [Gammaproteobacteria bacterium]MBU1893170.1 zinc-dependent alcohol dehydrogenase family protein [Gammaproteobacteria bacterium]
MRAVLMTAAGGPEVLQMADAPLPELPGPSHLRVKLHAAGVNPVDTKLRKGGVPKLPAILGCDGAGVVESVGSAVTRFQPGDEVFFFNGGIGGEQGNYAEYTVIHEEYAASRPASLSMNEAAALPLVWITAWESLLDRVQLKAGETVLIHAAAGGVGHVAVQLAKHLGAKVAVTVSGPDKAAFARELGADKIVDYRAEDFVAAALDWTGGQGVDVVFDTVGGGTFCRSFAAVSVYGRVVTLLQTACESGDLKTARSRNQSIHYELMLTPMQLSMHAARIRQREMLEAATSLIEAGKLKITVGRVLPLDQAAEAHRLIEEGHVSGKLVLEI